MSLLHRNCISLAYALRMKSLLKVQKVFGKIHWHGSAKQNKIHYLFVDTNIFLHYKIFTDIDWAKEFNMKQIKIVITSTTLSELDNKKYESHSKKVRERAEKVLSKIGAILDSDKPYEFRNGVYLHFLADEPRTDWRKERLDPNSKDDRLMAHILDFIRVEAMDTRRVSVVSGDTGLRIKAETRNIKVRRLSEDLRIIVSPDPVEKELEEVKKKLSKLQSLLPDLKLQFITASESMDVLEHRMSPSSSPLPQEEIDNKIRELEKGLTFNLPCSAAHSRLSQITNPLLPTEDEVKRYNNDAKEYLESYAEYMRKHWEYEEIWNRSIRLDFVLINSGSAPADDIDVFLLFEDGFEVKDSFLEQPTAPEHPRQPRSPYEIFKEGTESLSLFPSLRPNVTDLANPPSNITGPKIRKTNSYEVKFEIRRLKHGLQINLDSLYITFPSTKEAKPFHIDYNLLVANYPEEFKGQLHVKIEESKCQ